MVIKAFVSECGQLWRLRRLLGVMTRREVSARFAGSAGGLIWAWIPPLLTVASYYLLFDIVFEMRLGDQAGHARVGTYLIVGMLPWMGFSDAVQRGMGSLLEASGMLRKNPLPPGLFPVRSVLGNTVVYAPLVLILIPFYAGAHQFHVGVWTVFPLLLGQMCISVLAAYLLAILVAALRDVQQIVGVILSLGVFLTPVMFPVSMFPERWRWLLWLNPMTGPVLGYQSALLGGHCPALTVWLAIGFWIVLLVILLSTALSRSRDQLVDWL